MHYGVDMAVTIAINRNALPECQRRRSCTLNSVIPITGVHTVQEEQKTCPSSECGRLPGANCYLIVT